MKESGITWTKYTWNPWSGCTHVSEGCKFCYADRFLHGWLGKDFSNVTRSTKATFDKPYKISRQLPKNASLQDRLVFPCSLSDFFHEKADEWRSEAWKVIKENPNLIFQILTKRGHRIEQCLPVDWGLYGYKNVWIGLTCEDQDSYDKRERYFARLNKENRNYRLFCSMEPLLSDIKSRAAIPPFDWLIIGGESGNETGDYRYRPCSIVHIENIVQRYTALGVPVFVKQLGTYLAKSMNLKDKSGADVKEFPGCLQIQKFPKLKNTYNENLSLF